MPVTQLKRILFTWSTFDYGSLTSIFVEIRDDCYWLTNTSGLQWLEKWVRVQVRCGGYYRRRSDQVNGLAR